MVLGTDISAEVTYPTTREARYHVSVFLPEDVAGFYTHGEKRGQGDRRREQANEQAAHALSLSHTHKSGASRACREIPSEADGTVSAYRV